MHFVVSNHLPECQVLTPCIYSQHFTPTVEAKNPFTAILFLAMKVPKSNHIFQMPHQNKVVRQLFLSQKKEESLCHKKVMISYLKKWVMSLKQ